MHNKCQRVIVPNYIMKAYGELFDDQKQSIIVSYDMSNGSKAYRVARVV